MPWWVRRVAAAVALASALVVTACGDGDDGDAGDVAPPRAEWIAPALDAVAEAVGADPALLEVAATLEHVDVIVQDEPGRAVLYRYSGGGLDGPIEPRDDDRAVFTPREVAIDADHIFDGIRSELPGATILDLAVRAEGDAVVIDASVASEQGGLLLVLLGRDGSILGTRAT